MSVIAQDGSIGVYELKAHLSHVLQEVTDGRVVTITRHGHPIATLQPVLHSSLERRRAAINRILRSRRGHRLAPGETTKSLIEEGRRL